MRVLVVEDHPDLAYLLTELLLSEGFDVETCTRDFDRRLLDPRTWDGLDAVTFDLWLKRPDLSGEPDALPYIRFARESNPDLRICILSASDPRHLPCGPEIWEITNCALIKGASAHLSDIVEALRG